MGGLNAFNVDLGIIIPCQDVQDLILISCVFKFNRSKLLWIDIPSLGVKVLLTLIP